MNNKISVIGLGFVGSSMYKSFEMKNLKPNINLFGYDKYKDGGIGTLEECLNTDIMFLCLPTQYNSTLGQYDKSNIYNVCDLLEKYNYNGIVVIKSTVEPETTDSLSLKYKSLLFVHNPEFLTARTAFEDFHNQTHIVLGKSNNCSENKLNNLITFYKELYPIAEISICSCLESESMKIFCNCYYSVKVQFFTEIYLLCQKNNCNYEKVKNMMIKNNWINPMHTTIPGPDGQVSYGGLCFPKDTNALLKYMEKMNTPHEVLEGTINERNEMRTDKDNCI
jgi:UDPglucose 6-dehydrogenase